LFCFFKHNRIARAGEEEFYFDDIQKTTLASSTAPSGECLQETIVATTAAAHTKTSAIGIPGRSLPAPEIRITPVVPDPAILELGELNNVGTNIKRSKPVSVIQPVISPVLPRGFLFKGEADDDKTFFQHGSPIFTDSKQRRRKHSIGKKKCRKVYGMSNKDLWCTQCRWKKACVRFL